MKTRATEIMAEMQHGILGLKFSLGNGMSNSKYRTRHLLGISKADL